VVSDARLDRKATRLLTRFCRTEDPDTFRRLFELTGSRLLSLLRLILHQHRSGHDPSELLTDTFAQIYRSRGTFRSEGNTSFLSWFLAVAQNLLRQQHRERLRRGRREMTAAQRVSDTSTNPYTRLVRKEKARQARITCSELQQAVMEALDLLNPRSKQVLLLHTLHRLKYHEIAARLGISPGAVAMRIKRAREQIVCHVERALSGPGSIQSKGEVQ
jgi:RNA polymerase sigma-70 factor (ECF subfamily)